MRKTTRGPGSAAGLRPNARIRLAINLVGAGLWLSGGAWLICHYFLQRQGPWGPEPHVLEPWWLRLHGAFAFMAIWTVGLLWGVHVLRGWRSGDRRGTGAVLFAWLVIQMTSGYLLLHAGDDGAWGLVSPTHWIAGLALPGAYLAHRWLNRIRGPRP